MESLEPIYSGDINVIQANELIRARQDDLSLLEAKIVRLAIAQILKDDTDFETYEIKATKFAQLLGISRHEVYNTVKDISGSLLKKVIYMDNDRGKKLKRFQWVSEINYDNGVITIRLNAALKPYLIGLNELFTQYPYEEILGLPSYNSIRLFELLASFRNIKYGKLPELQYNVIKLQRGEILFSIKYLKEWFNCSGKYKQTGDFIRFVIDAGIDAIHKSTVMRVTYRKIKDGRAVTHLAFKIFSIGDSEYYQITERGNGS